MNERKKERLDRWLEKDSWSISEAILLLYGKNPNGYENIEDPFLRIPGASDSYNDTPDMLYETRIYLTKALKAKSEDEMREVRKVLEWAFLSEDIFYFDHDILNYLDCTQTGNPEITPHPEIAISKKEWVSKGLKWIDHDYKTLSRSELWSECEVLNVLCYYDQLLGRRYCGAYESNDNEARELNRNYGEKFNRNDRRIELKWQLGLAVEAGSINVVQSELLGKGYRPKEVIEWAQKMKHPLPKKLLLYLNCNVEIVYPESGPGRVAYAVDLYKAYVELHSRKGKHPTNHEALKHLKSLADDSRTKSVTEVFLNEDEVIQWITVEGDKKKVSKSSVESQLANIRKHIDEANAG